MAKLDTHGLLCPACKVIIDYAAVEAAALGIAEVATSARLRSAGHRLAATARGACQAEVEILRQDAFTQAQFDRMFKLWKDSCDRATEINKWSARLLDNDGEGAIETRCASLMVRWADEMERVPREIAEGQVPV